mmetsp:Transcript_27292/g.92901  ORF Transcript_27292/g.92901 Transcript_27292/m.92901 type:complete len:273 (-) Transcript_27292:69-887(-)
MDAPRLGPAPQGQHPRAVLLRRRRGPHGRRARAKQRRARLDRRGVDGRRFGRARHAQGRRIRLRAGERLLQQEAAAADAQRGAPSGEIRVHGRRVLGRQALRRHGLLRRRLRADGDARRRGRMDLGPAGLGRQGLRRGRVRHGARRLRVRGQDLRREPRGARGRRVLQGRRLSPVVAGHPGHGARVQRRAVEEVFRDERARAHPAHAGEDRAHLRARRRRPQERHRAGRARHPRAQAPPPHVAPLRARRGSLPPHPRLERGQVRRAEARAAG